MPAPPGVGFSGTVAISLDGATPAGFAAASVSTSSTTTLQLTTKLAPCGPSTLTLHGTSGSIDKTTTVSVTVADALTMTVVPDNPFIPVGGTPSVGVLVGGTSGPVALQLGPANSTCAAQTSFTASSSNANVTTTVTNAGGSGTLMLNAAAAATGSGTVTISANGAASQTLNYTVTSTLTVQVVDPNHVPANAADVEEVFIYADDNVVSATSNPDGTFSVAVPSTWPLPYNLGVEIHEAIVQIWLYDGLTRADPTIQVIDTPTTLSEKLPTVTVTQSLTTGASGKGPAARKSKWFSYPRPPTRIWSWRAMRTPGMTVPRAGGPRTASPRSPRSPSMLLEMRRWPETSS